VVTSGRMTVRRKPWRPTVFGAARQEKSWRSWKRFHRSPFYFLSEIWALRIHPKSLSLKGKQEWATSHFSFFPRQNFRYNGLYDQNALAALEHYTQKGLLALGSIKHTPTKVVLKLYYYIPTTSLPRSEQKSSSGIPGFAKPRDMCVYTHCRRRDLRPDRWHSSYKSYTKKGRARSNPA
jgi:hypothetical protein